MSGVSLLEFSTNPYNAVVVDVDALPEDGDQFAQRLDLSLDAWRDAQYGYVWLELPIAKSGFIPHAVEQGFHFHHSSRDYLMLGLKLREDVVELPFASHYIGAGGVVVSEANDLLVIREKVQRDNRPRPFKLPGGYIHAGEHLADGVEREVWEETGIRAKFESVACFRHWHANRFGKSDFYFVCRLTPLSFEITLQEEEITEARWMPVDEFLSRDDVYSFNQGIVKVALEQKGMMSSWFDSYDQDRTTREIFIPSDG